MLIILEMIEQFDDLKKENSKANPNVGILSFVQHNTGNKVIEALPVPPSNNQVGTILPYSKYCPVNIKCFLSTL